MYFKRKLIKEQKQITIKIYFTHREKILHGIVKEKRQKKETEHRILTDIVPIKAPIKKLNHKIIEIHKNILYF